MRKLRVFESISVDGYFCDANDDMGLVKAVRDLKASGGPGIVVLGSGQVAAQLGQAGLVHGYQFVIIPIALGGGLTVFTKGCRLRLVGKRTFACGNVMVAYER
jgi:dihydrofolate reductase